METSLEQPESRESEFVPTFAFWQGMRGVNCVQFVILDMVYSHSIHAVDILGFSYAILQSRIFSLQTSFAQDILHLPGPSHAPCSSAGVVSGGGGGGGQCQGHTGGHRWRDNNYRNRGGRAGHAEGGRPAPAPASAVCAVRESANERKAAVGLLKHWEGQWVALGGRWRQIPTWKRSAADYVCGVRGTEDDTKFT